MSIDSMCNHNVATIGPDASIADAAVRMREAHVGDLVVTHYREGRPFPLGIVTDRDLVVEVLAEGVDPAELKVGDVMSGDLVTVGKGNGIEHALRTMREHGLRRLPVVDDDDGALVGIVTLDDAVAWLARLVTHLAGALQVEQRTEAARRP